MAGCICVERAANRQWVAALFVSPSSKEDNMDNTTLLILIVVILLLLGGGWYGRGRWY